MISLRSNFHKENGPFHLLSQTTLSFAYLLFCKESIVPSSLNDSRHCIFSLSFSRGVRTNETTPKNEGRKPRGTHVVVPPTQLTPPFLVRFFFYFGFFHAPQKWRSLDTVWCQEGSWPPASTPSLPQSALCRAPLWCSNSEWNGNPERPVCPPFATPPPRPHSPVVPSAVVVVGGSAVPGLGQPRSVAAGGPPVMPRCRCWLPCLFFILSSFVFIYLSILFLASASLPRQNLRACVSTVVKSVFSCPVSWGKRWEVRWLSKGKKKEY